MRRSNFAVIDGYDLRRTFISLTRSDGARKDLLRLVTHGPDRQDMIELFSTFEWEVVCAEVAKLRLGRRLGAAVLRFERVAAASGDDLAGGLEGGAVTGDQGQAGAPVCYTSCYTAPKNTDENGFRRRDSNPNSRNQNPLSCP